jgi:hypothetical protein
MKKREQLEPFSLSFLDVISCGFGAVVMLVLIFKPQTEAIEIQEKPSSSSFELVSRVLALTELKDELMAMLQSEKSADSTVDMVSESLKTSLDRERQKLETSKAEIQELKKQLAAMSSKVETVKNAALSQGNKDKLDDEVAGIPVDRKYVIFIVDTSGSMKQIWDKVSRTMNKILEIHPKVDGFQIMNDNGNYLVSGYAKKWMQDTPTMRNRIMDLFSGWGSSSNSNPHEGMRQALSDYRNYQADLSIYVLGDDFTGGDFDSVLNEIDTLNKKNARINGLSFISPKASTDRFGTLMREVSQSHNGAFISIN